MTFQPEIPLNQFIRNWFHGKKNKEWKSTFFRTNSSHVLLMLLVFFVFQNIYNRLYGDLPIWFTEFQIEIVESERHHKSWFLFFSFWPKDAMQQSRTTTQNYYTTHNTIHKYINLKVHLQSILESISRKVCKSAECTTYPKNGLQM